MRLAQRAAAIAGNAPRQITRDSVPQIKERRQRIGVSAVFGDDGTEIRMDRGPFLVARQPHCTGARMAAVAGLHGAHHAKHIGALGRLGQQLGKVHARRAGGNGAERPAIITGGFRFGIKHVNMTRATPQPQHDDRLGLGRLARRPRLIARTQRHRQGRRSLQKRPPRLAATRVRLKISNTQHNVSLRPLKIRPNSMCHQANWRVGLPRSDHHLQLIHANDSFPAASPFARLTRSS